MRLCSMPSQGAFPVTGNSETVAESAPFYGAD